MTGDEEVAALMASLEFAKARGKPAPLSLLKDAVKACKPKRTAQPKAPPKSSVEKQQSHIRGRIKFLLNKLRAAEATIAAHKANPTDYLLAMDAATAWASISGLRMELQWQRENNPEIAAKLIPNTP